MIRHFKILMAAAVALTAFGAFGASAAQAVEEFHCSVEPCTATVKEDGTGKTAHHVFIVHNKVTTESVSFTCNEFRADATSATKTTPELTLTGLTYNGCTVNGSPGVTVDTNGCHYLVTAANGATGATVHVKCPAGKKIEVTIANCTFDIPEQTVEGIKYHNIGSRGTTEVTAESDIHKIKVEATGTQANCKINPNQELEGTYTTGNAVVTAESHTGVMAEGWWA